MVTQIKEAKQQRSELVADIVREKGLGNELQNSPAIKTADGRLDRLSEQQEEQMLVILASIEEKEALLADVETFIKRYGIFQELENQAEIARRGDDGRSNTISSATQTPKLFANFGEQLHAIWALKMGEASDKERNFLRQMNAVGLGAGEAAGADGGFLVQQDFATEIFRIMTEQGQILSRVRRTPVTGNGLKIPAINETSRVTGSRLGGVQGFWVAEGVAPTATQPSFRLIEFTLKKLAALGYATDELLEDTAAMASIFMQGFADELRWLAENAIVNGSGAGEPMGILNGGSVVSVSAETGQDAATIVTENIHNMWARMHAASRMNAVWLINQDIEPQLFALSLAVGTGGIPVYMPPGGLSAAPFGTLLGKPVIPVEYTATLGTVGDIILADLNQYMLIDKNGVRQDTSMHVQFITDQTAFRAIYRVDGKPLWNSPLTPANAGNTQSPFITLATRS